MYDPSEGRWVELDPIAFTAGDPDLYRYVGNDPANEIDPTGLVGFDVKGTYHQIVNPGKKTKAFQDVIDIPSLTKEISFPTDAYLKSIGVDPKTITAAQFKKLAGSVIQSMVNVDTDQAMTYLSKGQFQNDVLYRTWAVVFAKQLQANRLRFPAIGDPLASFPGSKNWASDNVTIVFRGKEDAVKGLVLKKGSTPADGIREFFAKGKPTVDCGTFASLVSRRALLEVLGDKTYNAKYAKVGIAGPNVKGDPYPMATIPAKILTAGNTFTFGFPDTVDAGAFQQENTICIAADSYLGHPIGVATAKGMMAAMETKSGKKGAAPQFATTVPWTILPTELK